jgi:hypothetical protein
MLDEQELEENMRNYLLQLPDVLQQIICNIRIRRDPTTHGNHIDLKPIVKRIANILSLSFVSGDKGYDSSEDNHAFIRTD